MGSLAFRAAFDAIYTDPSVAYDGTLTRPSQAAQTVRAELWQEDDAAADVFGLTQVHRPGWRGAVRTSEVFVRPQAGTQLAIVALGLTFTVRQARHDVQETRWLLDLDFFVVPAFGAEGAAMLPLLVSPVG